MPKELRVLKEVIAGATDYYEYWKDYKGERICIRTHSVETGEDKRGQIRQNTHVIEGNVKDVTSYPPGFLLKNVEEYLLFSDAEMKFSRDPKAPVRTDEGIKAKEILREIDEKYVSFDAIEELERADIAEEASEPFREENE